MTRIKAKDFKKAFETGQIQQSKKGLTTKGASPEWLDHLKERGELIELQDSSPVWSRSNKKQPNIPEDNNKPSTGVILVTIPEFRTHFRISNNKTKANRYMKANSQNFYNSNLTRFARNFFIEDMHTYVASYVKGLVVPSNMYPIGISMDLYVPVNYSTVRRVKGNISWKPPKPDYSPTFDIKNQDVWIKIFEDVLQIEGIIPDDNIEYVHRSGQCTWINEPDFNKRKIVFKIDKL